MLFSIVVPVYNVEKYLNECLDSIIPQILKIKEKSELLLIDDGSTDSSGLLCDQYREKYPNIISVYHNKNQGLLLTRRFGFFHAKGEYIINCDSDDTLENNALELLTEVIKKYNNPDMVIFNQNQFDDKGKSPIYKDILSVDSLSVVSKKDVLKAYVEGQTIVSMCGSVCKRSCIDIDKDYSIFSNVRNGEDSLQKIEQLDRANTFVYMNKCIYNYRMGSGMTSKFDPEYFQTFFIVLKETEKYLEKWNIENLDYLFAQKILSICGRAVTQLRYGLKGYGDWKSYLKSIRESNFFNDNIEKLPVVKSQLQKDHVFLLLLLKHNYFNFIYLLLSAKNLLDK